MSSVNTNGIKAILAGVALAVPLIAAADSAPKADASSFSAQSAASSLANDGKHEFRFHLDDHHHGFGGDDDHHHVPSVPEPGTAVMFLAGALGVGAIVRRNRRKDR